MKISLVIPAFNESARLPATLRRTATYLRTLPWSFEIVVSDDGSTDGTADVARQIAREFEEIRVLSHPTNRGKGHAVRLGMDAARGAVRVMYDADGSMPPEELPRLVAPVLAGVAEVVIGSRRVGGASAHGQPLWRRMWGRIANLAVQLALVPGVRDTQCGYKAFRADVAEKLFARATVDGWAFDLEVLALAKRLGMRVLEVGVRWADDRRSRVDARRDFGRVLAEAVAIRRNLDAGRYALAEAT